MKAKVSYLLFFLLYAAGLPVTPAQISPKNEPFSAGEVLTYEGKLSKAIVRGIAIADMKFNVETAPNGRDYLITTEAVSKGSLPKLLKFSFLQKYQSTIDREKFRVLKTVKHDEQGDRVRDSEAVFDYNKKMVAYVETDPNDMARPPRRIASEIPDNTLDFISGAYSIRRLPLAVGKTFELSISDSGLVYKIPVRVAARELQNSILGKVWCFRVEPEVFGAKRLFEDEGKMIIWITDDKSRIPIRAQIQAGIGKVEVKLQKVGK